MTSIAPAISAPTADDLAALLKASGDPLRLEILRVLQRDSYGVLELCQILDLKQSALSYQLKVLATVGLVSTRKEGNSVFYRRAAATGPQQHLLRELFRSVDALALSSDVQARVETIQRSRTEASRDFFARNADRFHDYQDLIASHHDYGSAIESLLSNVVPADASTVLEVGPGEGELLPLLSQRFEKVIALDLSKEMLKKSRTLATDKGLTNIRFSEGDTGIAIKRKLHADCITINMVLHHVPSPSDVFADLGELLKPGGALLVTDLCRHDQNWAKESCGDLWMGFDPEELTEWARQAGLSEGQSQYLALRNGFRVQLRHFVKTRDVK